MQGRGERITPVVAKNRLYGLLIVPSVSVSSGECYQEYDRCQGERKSAGNTEKCIEALTENRLKDVGRYLTNDLFCAAARLAPEVQTAQKESLAFSPLGVVMTGSGSGVVALFETRELCEWAKSRYKGKFSTYVIQTVIPQYEKKKSVWGWKNPFALTEEEQNL